LLKERCRYNDRFATTTASLNDRFAQGSLRSRIASLKDRFAQGSLRSRIAALEANKKPLEVEGERSATLEAKV